jgi:phytoene synthase
MSGAGARSGSDAGTVVREAARNGDRDRFLAALLAPRSVRDDLIALTAFLGEVARISNAVTEPMMGEMRLQWWCDAIANRATDARTGNPIADALVAVIDKHALPQETLLGIIDARGRELGAAPFANLRDLDRYLDETEGAAFRLGARILGAEGKAPEPALLTAAGQAYGRVALLRQLPALLAKGRDPLGFAEKPGSESAGDANATARQLLQSARAWLAEARQLAAGTPRAIKPALLPLALVEPYLTALEGLGPDIERVRADISPLSRVWRLWRASMRGSF